MGSQRHPTKVQDRDKDGPPGLSGWEVVDSERMTKQMTTAAGPGMRLQKKQFCEMFRHVSQLDSTMQSKMKPHIRAQCQKMRGISRERPD